MRLKDRHDAPAPSRRKLRPALESLEARDLPSATPLSTPTAPAQSASATIRALGDPTGLTLTDKSTNLPYSTAL